MTDAFHTYVNRDLPPMDRGCVSKAPFVSRGEAKQAVKAAAKHGISLKPYHCRYFDHWHVSSRKGKS